MYVRYYNRLFNLHSDFWKSRSVKDPRKKIRFCKPWFFFSFVTFIFFSPCINPAFFQGGDPKKIWVCRTRHFSRVSNIHFKVQIKRQYVKTSDTYSKIGSKAIPNLLCTHHMTSLLSSACWNANKCQSKEKRPYKKWTHKTMYFIFWDWES